MPLCEQTRYEPGQERRGGRISPSLPVKPPTRAELEIPFAAPCVARLAERSHPAGRQAGRKTRDLGCRKMQTLGSTFSLIEPLTHLESAIAGKQQQQHQQHRRLLARQALLFNLIG